MGAPVGNENAKGNGRPTDYKEEYDDQVYRLALLGCTDAEIGVFFGVTEQTINNWKKEHDCFFESLSRGKEQADMNVVKALYDKAVGAEWIEQQAFKVKIDQYTEEVQIVDVRRADPPDTPAIKMWLTNRQPSKWREKQDVDVKHSGILKVAKDPADMTPDELRAEIASLEATIAQAGTGKK